MEDKLCQHVNLIMLIRDIYINMRDINKITLYYDMINLPVNINIEWWRE